MSWINRIEPVTLSQSSDLPYVILKNGVYLCFDNIYSESVDKLDHTIRFVAHKSNLIKQSINAYRFKKFPVSLSFNDVLSLDDTIVDGKIIKHASYKSPEHKNVLIAKSSFIDTLEDQEFQEVFDKLDEYDKSFLLTNDHLSSYDRLLSDTMTALRYRGWNAACVAIADALCPKSKRKYCWTSSVPELRITLYGFDNSDDIDDVSTCFENIGISDVEISVD